MINFLAEKMPEQRNRSGMSQCYLLIKMRSAAAAVAVSETEPSKLTEMSALKDNVSNTARSNKSRVNVERFTTCLLVRGLVPPWISGESRVFLPLLIGVDHFGASASSFRSISKKTTRFQDDTASPKRDTASCRASVLIRRRKENNFYLKNLAGSYLKTRGAE